MDKTIEEIMIVAIKHPINTLAIAAVILLSYSILQILRQKVSWIYRRKRFFKQLEMKLYSR